MAAQTAREFHITLKAVRESFRQEFTARCQAMDKGEAEKTRRYGAMVGCRIEQHAELCRGMELAHRLIDEAEAHGKSLEDGTIILADTLTGGRGRFQRDWHAPRGGIWLTLVLADTLLPEFSRLHTLTAGIACCEMLRAFKIDASLKWINDLLADNCKIGGILAESFTSRTSKEEYVLLGIGINVNNDEFPHQLADSATSAKRVLGSAADIRAMTRDLLAKLAWNLGLLRLEEEKHMAAHMAEEEIHYGPLAPNIINRWKELSDTIGRRVCFGFDVQTKPLFNAVAVDIDQQGGLVLQHADGSTSTEHSGEIIYLEGNYSAAPHLRTICPPSIQGV